MTGSLPPARRRFILRILGSLVLLALLWVFFPAEQLRQGFQRVEAAVFAAVLGSFLLTHLLGAFKWNYVLRGVGAGLEQLTTLRCYYLGLFSNLFMPSVIGGDLVSVAAALRHTGNRTGVVVASLVNRGLDLFALVGLAMVGALALPGMAGRSTWRMLAGLAACGGAAMVAAVWAARRQRWSFKMRRRLVKVRRVIRLAASRPWRMLAVLAASAGLQAALAALAAWIAASCGLALPFQVWLFAWTLSKVVAFLPIAQGGIGVREYALAGILAPLGVAPGTAASVGLVWEAVVIGGGLAGGIIAFSVRRWLAAPLREPVGAAE